VLLMSAALFVRSLAKLHATNPGFQTAGILEAELIENTRASKTLDAPVYYRELTNRIEHLPGVVSAAMSEIAPASNFQNKVSVVAEPSGSGSPNFQADLEMFSPGVFRTLGIRLEQGLDFAWTDDNNAPSVAVVSESLAQQLFPCGDAVGRHITVGPDNFPFKQRNLQVIGLASDASFWNIRERHLPELYIPALQSYMQYGELLVRTDMDLLALASSVRGVVDSMGREYVLQTRSLPEQVDRSLLQERVIAMFSAFFGGLALLLASIGLYGLMSYTVTRRTREIGIRLALGAQRQRVLWMVLRETLALLLAGIAVGIPCALVATQLMAKQLFGLSARDPLTLGIVALALLAVGILAGYLPARRATKVDPILALRHE
jgi:predicted permease